MLAFRPKDNTPAVMSDEEMKVVHYEGKGYPTKTKTTLKNVQNIQSPKI